MNITILRNMPVLASGMPKIALTPEVTSLLLAHAPVAIGVSGGKDGILAAFETVDFLDQIGHRGPRVLIHADLGRVEWNDSLPMCRRLAERLTLELIVVRRQAGDMMDRWATRWSSNVQRYSNLQCVKLILPWSTPGMRFCTSELKLAVVCRELILRFPGQTIVSVSGIRRQESKNRAQAPIARPQPRLTSVTHGTSGIDWHPVIDWTRDEVLDSLAARNFPLHEAYTRYGSSRVSCCFCIMASRPDLFAATTARENHEIYRTMCELEITSTFSFQSDQWLSDVAPHLLDSAMRAELVHAKARGRERESIEALIPPHLWFTKEGWPKVIPTRPEAQVLSDVRQHMGELMSIPVSYTTPDTIIARYEELIARRVAAEHTKTKKKRGKKRPAATGQPRQITLDAFALA